MENNDWEKRLRDILGDYDPKDIKPDWDEFADYQREHEYLEELSEDAHFDENLRESLSTFEVTEQAQGWDRIEQHLETDEVFDDEVRRRITHFQPQYDPHTWTLLMSRLSGIGYLRAKLIAFKVVEVASVLLLLLTVVKMGTMGKLPFDTPLYKEEIETAPPATTDRADATPTLDNTDVNSGDNLLASDDGNKSQAKSSVISSESFSAEEKSSNNFSKNKTTTATSATQNLTTPLASNTTTSSADNVGEVDKSQKTLATTTTPSIVTGISQVENKNTATDIAIGHITDKVKSDQTGWVDAEAASMPHNIVSANFLATSFSPITWQSSTDLPSPRFVKQRAKTYTEFGIVAQMDYNKLRMPEDRLYSAGRQIVFPQQGIPSTGMGGGFTIGIGHPRWAVETGIIYNSKTFKPGRQLIVGGAFNNGSVDFDALRLQTVTMPLQFRYRIDAKGPLKVYAVAGGGVHLVAQSDVDVVIKYSFPSLSAGENPNNDPALVQTIQETKRISQHIRDGAPLSTKNYLSINGGAGIEYAVPGHKVLFLQAIAQYQVPQLEFSNNDGKHIRSMLIQTGIRTALGK